MVHSCAQLQYHFDLTLVVDSRSGSLDDIEHAYGVSLDRVKIIRVSHRMGPFSSNKFFNRRLYDVLPSGDPCLLYVRHLKSAQALLAKRKSNWRIVFEAHELFYKTTSSRAKAKKLFAQEDYIYSNVDAIAPICRTLGDDIVSEFKTNAPMLVLPTGATLPEAMPQKSFSKIESIYYIGGLMKWKGIDTLLEAYAKAPDLPPLEVIGDADGARMAEIRELINELGLLHKVHLRGRLLHSEVASIIHRQARLCVLPNNPSPYERYTMPLKIWEYMAGGNIVVYSRLPSLAEIELAGTIGVGFGPGNASELASALSDICERPHAYAHLPAEAFALAGRYSWTNRARKFADFAQRL